MKYLLDMDICIALINDRPLQVIERFRRHQIGDVGVSGITVSELAFGVAKTQSKRNAHALEKTCQSSASSSSRPRSSWPAAKHW